MSELSIKEGEEILVEGDLYTVVGIDPSREGVRAYHLSDGSGDEIRLTPRPREEMYGLIRVSKVEPGDIEKREEGSR